MDKWISQVGVKWVDTVRVYLLPIKKVIRTNNPPNTMTVLLRSETSVIPLF